MEKSPIGARSVLFGCLAAAGGLLVLDVLLRAASLVGLLWFGAAAFCLEYFVFPAGAGLVMGWRIGPWLRHPKLAALLLGGALLVTAVIPYTFDTRTMARITDEEIVSMVREDARHPELVRLPPSELRRYAVQGRIWSFVTLAPLLFGGWTVIGTVVGRRLRRRTGFFAGGGEALA